MRACICEKMIITNKFLTKHKSCFNIRQARIETTEIIHMNSNNSRPVCQKLRDIGTNLVGYKSFPTLYITELSGGNISINIMTNE